MFTKKQIVTLVVSIIAAAAFSVRAQDPEQVFHTDFADGATTGWELKNTVPEFVEDAEATSGKVMVIKSTNIKLTQIAKIPMDIEKLKGKKVTFKIRYKVEEVKIDPANQYAGAKIFFVYERGTAKNRGGASEKEVTRWKEIEQKTPTLDGLTAAGVTLGFQAATGVLKVDYVTISVK